MNKLFIAAFAASIPTMAFAQPPLESFWDNNGSLMRTVDDGFRVAVYYHTVRPSLRATTPPGAVAFDGTRVNGNGIVGNAFVYTKYCYGKPFPYRVTGYINGTIDVSGAAAVVDPNSCRIVGYRWDSDNAHRIFQAVPPPVVEAPQPYPVPVPTPVPVPYPIPTEPTGPVQQNGPNQQTGPGHVIVCPVVGDCLPTTPKKTAPQTELSPDEQAEELRKRAREFCWKFPGRPECGQPTDDRRGSPSPAVPLDK